MWYAILDLSLFCVFLRYIADVLLPVSKCLVMVAKDAEIRIVGYNGKVYNI